MATIIHIVTNPFSHSAPRKTGRDQRLPADISEQGGTEEEQTRRNDNNSSLAIDFRNVTVLDETLNGLLNFYIFEIL